MLYLLFIIKLKDKIVRKKVYFLKKKFLFGINLKILIGIVNKYFIYLNSYCLVEVIV